MHHHCHVVQNGGLAIEVLSGGARELALAIIGSMVVYPAVTRITDILCM